MVNAVGVIGCGRIAERHLAAYRHLGVKVTLFDVDVLAAERRAQEFGLDYVTTLDALLDRPDIEAIDLCVPTTHHRSLAIAGAEHGKHIFCEKPLCQTLDEAYAIKSAIVNNRVHLMVGYLYRFYPVFQYVKQVLDDDIIGPPTLAFVRLGGRGDAAVWKHKHETGGGAISEMMVHALDLIRWLLGDIESVELIAREVLYPVRHINGETVKATAEDFVLARLHTEHGIVFCESDLATPSYMNHVEIQGSNGSIFTSMLHYLPTQVYCKQARGIFDRGATTQEFPIINAFEHELRAFIGILRGEVELINSVDDSIALLKVLEQMYVKEPVSRSRSTSLTA
ncbi:MAG: Gfo/Idh/MocA family oxidoreductase [Chloroflexi bacterium]|nr:Gfo/Idh/MocA family oxidoreductase [Chloroflexota bacterium]